MKKLFCLLFIFLVSCEKDAKETIEPVPYVYNGGVLTSTKDGIIFEFYDSTYFNVYQKVLLTVENDSIPRHPGAPAQTFTFKVTFIGVLQNTN